MAEKNAEAVVVDQSNSKSITAFVLARKDFNDATIEDASMKSKFKNTKSYDDENSSCEEIAKSNIHINRTKTNLRSEFKSWSKS